MDIEFLGPLDETPDEIAARGRGIQEGRRLAAEEYRSTFEQLAVYAGDLHREIYRSPAPSAEPRPLRRQAIMNITSEFQILLRDLLGKPQVQPPEPLKYNLLWNRMQRICGGVFGTLNSGYMRRK